MINGLFSQFLLPAKMRGQVVATLIVVLLLISSVPSIANKYMICHVYYGRISGLSFDFYARQTLIKLANDLFIVYDGKHEFDYWYEENAPIFDSEIFWCKLAENRGCNIILDTYQSNITAAEIFARKHPDRWLVLGNGPTQFLDRVSTIPNIGMKFIDYSGVYFLFGAIAGEQARPLPPWNSSRVGLIVTTSQHMWVNAMYIGMNRSGSKADLIVIETPEGFDSVRDRLAAKRLVQDFGCSVVAHTTFYGEPDKYVAILEDMNIMSISHGSDAILTVGDSVLTSTVFAISGQGQADVRDYVEGRPLQNITDHGWHDGTIALAELSPRASAEVHRKLNWTRAQLVSDPNIVFCSNEIKEKMKNRECFSIKGDRTLYYSIPLVDGPKKVSLYPDVSNGSFYWKIGVVIVAILLVVSLLIYMYRVSKSPVAPPSQHQVAIGIIGIHMQPAKSWLRSFLATRDIMIDIVHKAAHENNVYISANAGDVCMVVSERTGILCKFAAGIAKEGMLRHWPVGATLKFVIHVGTPTVLKRQCGGIEHVLYIGDDADTAMQMYKVAAEGTVWCSDNAMLWDPPLGFNLGRTMTFTQRNGVERAMLEIVRIHKFSETPLDLNRLSFTAGPKSFLDCEEDGCSLMDELVEIALVRSHSSQIGFASDLVYMTLCEFVRTLAPADQYKYIFLTCVPVFTSISQFRHVAGEIFNLFYALFGNWHCVSYA